ncbi:MAG TPA: amidohydrolase family protein [Acidimicrobiales bacterium]|nr:amidohydrolase family protein [Acidimicrobiales bacterium]
MLGQAKGSKRPIRSVDIVAGVITKAAQIRSQLDHPVIDADGHFVELAPVLDDELLASLEAEGGSGLRDRYVASRATPFDTSTVLAQRSDANQAEWKAMPSWWGWQTRNTRDRATSHLPRLLYERLDEMGIDFSILYPSTTLGLIDIDDPELAAPVARAVNTWLAGLFRPYSDRLTVGAIIPMVTPDVAVAELRHAVRALGFKTVVISGYATRYLGDASAAPRAYRLDHFGIDSTYDYDPVWEACVELGVAPVSHSAHQHHRVSRSPSSYVYNHIGGLATSHESLAKSLFLGGVTRRFPTLRVGFLEGGVAWAASLFADLVGHWEKRNGQTINDLDPDRLDVDALMGFMREYGDKSVLDRLDRIRDHFARPAGRPEEINEFARTGIVSREEFVDLFVPRFYFGCEADDPLVAWSFAEKVNPLGARFRPIFGSDISHWDVPDMTEPVEEAHELVERGVLGKEEFRELMFLNPVRLHTGTNPHFFDGTVVAAAARDAMERDL